MWTGRSAGRAYLANHLSDLDLIADFDVYFRQMAVAGGQTIAVVDFHHSAVAARRSRRDYFPVSGGAHGIAGCRAKIETRVHRRSAKEWIATDPETAGKLDLSHDRLAIWHQSERSI